LGELIARTYHSESVLALGGDEASRINTDSNDSYFIAAQIAEIVKTKSIRSPFLPGKESH
jgi:electron transfer flavoprotein beta subunit